MWRSAPSCRPGEVRYVEFLYELRDQPCSSRLQRPFPQPAEPRTAAAARMRTLARLHGLTRSAGPLLRRRHRSGSASRFVRAAPGTLRPAVDRPNIRWSAAASTRARPASRVRKEFSSASFDQVLIQMDAFLALALDAGRSMCS